MAPIKFSSLSLTTDSNGIVPIVNTPGLPASKINLRDAIIALISGGLVYLGKIDGSTVGNFPTGNSGDMYSIVNSGANPSVVNGISLSTGDLIICNTNTTPPATPANRDIIPNIQIDATEFIKGVTAYATTAETKARTISNKAVVPSALADFILNTDLPSDVLNEKFVTYRVQMIFDDAFANLPLTTATQIDGQTVVTGDLVYVKEALNPAIIDSVYSAVVTGSNIVWTYEYTVGDNAVYSETGTQYGNGVFIDASVTYFFSDIFADNISSNKVTTNELDVEKITSSNYNFKYSVDLVFDDALNSLPLTTATQIDGVTVTDGDKIYVKNSATPSEVGNIYIANVDLLGNITYTLFATPTSGDTIYSQDGDIYGDTSFDSSTTTVTNISNLQTDNIITSNYNLNYNVGMVFDDALNSLPFTTATQIDGQTITDGNLVYVKNSSNPTEVGKIFKASVDGLGNISRTEKQQLKAGDTVYSQTGDTYGDTINNYSNTTVQNGVNSSVLPKKLEISDTGNTIVLTSEPLGGADGLTVLYKNSGMNFFETTDYLYDSLTKTVTLIHPLSTGETVQVKWLEGVVALDGNVSDAVYDASRDGDSTNAPSKNAVYDKIEDIIGLIPSAILGVLFASENFAVSPVSGDYVIGNIPAGTKFLTITKYGDSYSGSYMTIPVYYGTPSYSSVNSSAGIVSWRILGNTVVLNSGPSGGTTIQGSIQYFM